MKRRTRPYVRAFLSEDTGARDGPSPGSELEAISEFGKVVVLPESWGVGSGRVGACPDGAGNWRR